jgi:2-keto-4-pentenoate hydratase/2-oxohepta-3-ene-1,7-dioic acid hydratase in catechol pathway
MRLIRYGTPGAERPGVLIDDTTALDLSDRFSDIDESFWATDGVTAAREALANHGDQRVVDLREQRLGAPIARPSQVLCIGLNYSDHAAESGAEVPREPVVFNKAPSTVIGPFDDVLLPPTSEKTDWEVELAVVIGRRARYLQSEADAAGCIGGYAISNDVSEREYQLERGGQWVKGKSCETFNPLGPWLVTPDEVDDVQNLRLRLDVNTQAMQDGSTADMVFGVNYLVWYLSHFMVLEPGDLINTGTPAGVGLGQRPPRYLKEADVMELAIDGLGSQRQVLRRATV